MTTRKEDGVINTNYNNHVGLEEKCFKKKKKEEGKRNLSKRKPPGTVSWVTDSHWPEGTQRYAGVGRQSMFLNCSSIISYFNCQIISTVVCLGPKLASNYTFLPFT